MVKQRKHERNVYRIFFKSSGEKVPIWIQRLIYYFYNHRPSQKHAITQINETLWQIYTKRKKENWPFTWHVLRSNITPCLVQLCILPCSTIQFSAISHNSIHEHSLTLSTNRTLRVGFQGNHGTLTSPKFRQSALPAISTLLSRQFIHGMYDRVRCTFL